MCLSLLASFFSNSADVIFFSAILVALGLVLIVFIASKIVSRQRDKKYEALEKQKAEGQEGQETAAEEQQTVS